MDTDKLLQILGRIPLFRDLSEAEKQHILAMPKTYQLYKADDVIVNEGEMEPYFYILLTGRAKVTLKDQTIAIVEPPEFVGEVGFMCHEPRIATVIAEEQVMAMKMNTENFNKLPMSVREVIKDKIILGLVGRLKQVNSTLADFKNMPFSRTSLDDKFAEYELI